jgi:hypothetical protein
MQLNQFIYNFLGNVRCTKASRPDVAKSLASVILQGRAQIDELAGVVPPRLPKSPPAGEAGEHKTLYAYVPGNYDAAVIKLEGFTLISDNDLAYLKANAMPPPKLEPCEYTDDDLRALHVAIDEAAGNRGLHTDDLMRLEEFDCKISRARRALAKLRDRKKLMGKAKKQPKRKGPVDV